MPKANRTCYCCGRKYYYCTSCPDDRRDPRVYVMWDSELCKEIFNVLTDETFKKITTLECKKRLIELGVTKETVLKESVRKHVDRVMSYEEVTEKVIEEIIEVPSENILEETVVHKEGQSEIIVESDEDVNSIVIETEVEENTCKTVEPITVVEKTENIKKVKRTKKSSLKNKENSEVN